MIYADCACLLSILIKANLSDTFLWFVLFTSKKKKVDLQKQVYSEPVHA